MGRKKDPLWGYFTLEDGKYTCTGCETYFLTGKVKIDYLNAHLRKCPKLQEKIQMADEAETAARKERELGKRRMMQTSLAEYFVGQDDMKSFADVWTLFFVKSGNVSRRALGLQTFVDAARFTQEHKAAHALTPHKIDESLKRLKEHIVKDVKSDAGEKQQQVCLIVDGWKVTHRIEHAHGVLFSNWTGETVFHTMVADLERHVSVYSTPHQKVHPPT